MNATIDLNAAYRTSTDIVSREIEGEIILVPIASGIGDMEGELYSLNETGKIIWQSLDTYRDLNALIVALSGQYNAPATEIQADVIGLISELIRRRMVEKV